MINATGTLLRSTRRERVVLKHCWIGLVLELRLGLALALWDFVFVSFTTMFNHCLKYSSKWCNMPYSTLKKHVTAITKKHVTAVMKFISYLYWRAKSARSSAICSTYTLAGGLE